MIEEALSQANGNKHKASQRLGLSRQGLIKKLKRLGMTAMEIDRAADANQSPPSVTVAERGHHIPAGNGGSEKSLSRNETTAVRPPFGGEANGSCLCASQR
jgi:hypothetical protein